MEETAQIEKKQTNLYLFFAAAVVIILALLGYFYFFAPSPIPQSFFLAYKQQDAIARRVLTGVVFDYASLSKVIQSQDASAAAVLAKGNLVQSLKNESSIDTVEKKTTALKLLLVHITDNTLRGKTIELFTKLDERNKRLHAVSASQTDIFTALRNRFGALAVGGKAPEMAQNIDIVISATQTEIQAISQLQISIDVLYEEIVKLSGVDTSVSETVDLIKLNLSATPEMEPNITDFPTPTASPTLLPTEVPASDSATATNSAN